MKKFTILPAILFLTLVLCMAPGPKGMPKGDTNQDLHTVTHKKPVPKKSVVLVAKGHPTAVIVDMTKTRGRDEKKKMRVALRELRECIEISTGEKPRIVRKRLPKGPAIIIGDCEAAQRQGLKGYEMPIEGFEIKTAPGNRVFIVGNGLGNAWGVFEFLERYMGVRWYWPKERGGRDIPKRKTLELRPTWISDAPHFRMREIWPPFGNSPYREGKQNLTAFQSKLRSGGSWPQRIAVHKDSGLKKVKYYRNITEMWQKDKAGKADYIHPCYSSKEAVDAFMREIRLHFKEGKKPNIGIRGNTITVSPADIGISCHCDKCRKLWNPEAGQYGTASEIMSRFVKRLGERLKKEFPNKNILFLPYQNYTLPPKNVTFPDNVYVQICHMPGIALYKESKLLKRWQGYIDGWYKLTGHPIQDWHYSCWPADRTKAPYTYHKTVKSYYVRNREKTVGSFINGNKNHWPRFHVTLYCWMKCLWKPDFNVEAMVDAYCRRMYGPASQTVREILDIMAKGWEGSDWGVTSFSPKVMYKKSYGKKNINRLKALLKKAEGEVKGDTMAEKRLAYFASPFPAFFKEYEMVMEGKGKPNFIIQKVAEKPKVDGRLDDEVWKKAKPIQLVTRKKNKEVKPDFPTKVMGVFTLDGISLAFHMHEPQPDKLRTKFDTPDSGSLWHNDCVEIFLDPPNDGSSDFYQFIIPANLILYDAFGGDKDWDAKGLKVAKAVGKDYWSLEVFIPLSAFKKVNKLGTTTWSGQITRHRSKFKKKGRGENQRLNYESGNRNASRADFCPVVFRE